MITHIANLRSHLLSSLVISKHCLTRQRTLTHFSVEPSANLLSEHCSVAKTQVSMGNFSALRATGEWPLASDKLSETRQSRAWYPTVSHTAEQQGPIIH